MEICHFGGIIECNSVEDLHSILSLRYGDSVNEFILSGNKRYPCLYVMVNHEYATLIFLSEESDSLFQSIGGLTDLDPDETSVFYSGSVGEEIQVYNEFVLPLSKAIEAAVQFFSTLAKPTCVDWSEE